jgi:hypothetical protein
MGRSEEEQQRTRTLPIVPSPPSSPFPFSLFTQAPRRARRQLGRRKGKGEGKKRALRVDKGGQATHGTQHVQNSRLMPAARLSTTLPPRLSATTGSC